MRSGASQGGQESVAPPGDADAGQSSQSQGRTGACRPCRTRKVKCDKQVICSRCRGHEIECVYDEIPNRRGPDRTPRRRRRPRIQPQARHQRNENEDEEPPVSCTLGSSSSQPQNTQNFTMVPFVPPAQGQPMKRPGDPNSSTAWMATHVEANAYAYASSGSVQDPETDGVDQDVTLHSSSPSTSLTTSPRASSSGHPSPSPGPLRSESSSISSNPSLQFYRKTWWDLLLSAYSPVSEDAVHSIEEDFNLFFEGTSHQLSFLHVPTFLENVFRPQTRERMQPSLVLSLLALSSVMQARHNQPSKLNLAMTLHLWSHSAFETSVNAQWIDIQLAQAAILMSVFEATPQNLQSYDRLSAAWDRIDILATILDLHNIDAGRPDVFVIERSAQSGTYLDSLCDLHVSTAMGHGNGMHSVLPTMPEHYTLLQTHQTNGTVDLCARPYPEHIGESHLSPNSASPPGFDFNPFGTCSCQEVSLMTGRLWQPTWHKTWSLEDIQKEEGRRVFWKIFSLIAYGLSHQSAHHTPPSRFRIVNLPRIAVYLPGEAPHFARGLQPSARTTVWALNARAYLLWVAAIQLHEASSRGLMSPERQAPIAAQVWLETERLTNALNEHRCGIEATQMFTARNFLQLSRMIATKDFSQHIPSAYAGLELVQRREAETWIAHLKFFVDRANVPEERHGLMRNVAKNPWTVWYLVDHTQRCLDLWRKDPSLIVALEVANRMQPALQAIIQKYTPAPFLERFGNDLAASLREARHAAGLGGRPCPTPSPGESNLQLATPDRLVLKEW